MDYYKVIAGEFEEIIELISMSVDGLVPHVRRANAMCSEALLGERKILACGNGAAAALAQIFCASLLHRFETERPALPAIALCADTSTLSALAAAGGGERYARQVRALGQPGDILLAIAIGDGEAGIIQSMRAAREREMRVVVLSGGESSDIASLLSPEDCQLHVASQRPPRIVEMQAMLLHCLCGLIDRTLFGGNRP